MHQQYLHRCHCNSNSNSNCCCCCCCCCCQYYVDAGALSVQLRPWTSVWMKKCNDPLLVMLMLMLLQLPLSPLWMRYMMNLNSNSNWNSLLNQLTNKFTSIIVYHIRMHHRNCIPQVIYIPCDMLLIIAGYVNLSKT
ncbi:MAG: hypothetical protein ACI8RD_011479 [Bacillariaceae sp.]|jgi:hypothetical protein